MKKKLSGGVVHQLPTDLTEALTSNKKVADLWEALTPIGRNEFICWVEDAKQEKTRLKRVNRAVEELLEGQKRPCCWVGCIHRTDKKPGKWQQAVLIDRNPRRQASKIQ
ncbi:MAG: YdeI/OmpD-associated family protein [Steroidobacteraceae bacterium]